MLCTGNSIFYKIVNFLIFLCYVNTYSGFRSLTTDNYLSFCSSNPFYCHGIKRFFIFSRDLNIFHRLIYLKIQRSVSRKGKVNVRDAGFPSFSSIQRESIHLFFYFKQYFIIRKIIPGDMTILYISTKRRCMITLKCSPAIRSTAFSRSSV